MATTQSIESRKIIAHRGIGVGVAIMGGRSGGYENTLQDGRVAVAGADLDDKVVGGSMLMVSHSDTAVVLA